MNVPIAANCWAAPATMLELEGLTAIEMSVGELMVKRVDPFTAPAVALIVVWPADTPVATPVGPMLATPGDELAQFTDAVRSCWEPSVKVPTALNGCEVPGFAKKFWGLT